MSAQIIPFEGGKLPSFLSRFKLTDDLSRGISQGFPSLSIKGKEFTVVRGDDRTLITRKNDDGEDEAVRSILVSVIKANPGISKVWYEGKYSEGQDSKPACFSNDGIAPAADSVKPQCATCASCPRNQWGSRITEDGKKGKECADSRRVAVASLDALADPMLLRVPATSLKALAEYNKLLKVRGVPYQAVVTRIGFEKGAAHPSLVFKPVGFLNDAQADEVFGMVDSDVVNQIVGLDVAPAAANDVPKIAPIADEDEPAPAPKKAKAKPAPVMVDEDEDEPAPAPAPKPKAKPAPVAVDEDDDEEEGAPAPKAKKAKPAIQMVDDAASDDDKLLSGIQGLLGGLDDFDDE